MSLVTYVDGEIIQSEPAYSIEADRALEGLLSEVGRKTAITYGPAIREFLEWVQQNPGRHPAVALAMFLRHQHQDLGWSAETVNKKRVAVRRFFDWAAMVGSISQQDLMQIKQVKGIKSQGGKEKTWITQDKMQELVNLPVHDTLSGKRDRVVLALLLGCALRRSEVTSITWGQVVQRGEVWVLHNVSRKHGRIQPVIPMPKWVHNILVDFKDCINPDPDDPIAVRIYKGGRVGSSLSDSGVYYILKRYQDKLGIEISPHDLRRSWARAARENGAELTQIQQVLGHENVAVTQKYIGEILDLESAVDFVTLEIDDAK